MDLHNILQNKLLNYSDIDYMNFGATKKAKDDAGPLNHEIIMVPYTCLLIEVSKSRGEAQDPYISFLIYSCNKHFLSTYYVPGTNSC